jgi:uncharacterized membrane protein YdjX (TVP38/TMEM64 family)
MKFPDSLSSLRPMSRHLPYVLVLAAIVALIWWLASGAVAGQFPLESWRAHHDDLLNLVRGNPLTATAALFLMHVLLATLGLPGASLLMLVAGAGFGAFAGTLLCLLPVPLARA